MKESSQANWNFVVDNGCGVGGEEGGAGVDGDGRVGGGVCPKSIFRNRNMPQVEQIGYRDSAGSLSHNCCQVPGQMWLNPRFRR